MKKLLVAILISLSLVVPVQARGASYGMPGFNIPYTGCFTEDSRSQGVTTGVLDSGQTSISTVRFCTFDENGVGAGGEGLKWELTNAPVGVTVTVTYPNGTTRDSYIVSNPTKEVYGADVNTKLGQVWVGCKMPHASISSGTSGHIPLVEPIDGGIYTITVVNNGPAMKLDNNQRNDMRLNVWNAMGYAPFQTASTGQNPPCPTQDQNLEP